MRIKRGHAYSIRNAIHEVEGMIPRNDRSQVAEIERDLIATACVSIWEVKLKKLISCLYRLTRVSKDRADKWQSVYALAISFLT